MAKVETIFEGLEKALVDYRLSLKNIEDEPGEMAKQYAKDAAQDTKLRLSIKQGLKSLKNLEIQLPPAESERVHQRRQALKQEYDNLIHHHLSG